MVIWIGLDDTDSLSGMCTTFLATEIIRVLSSEYDLIRYPRLVRLNPNIPWKTRGNGAIALRFGRGRGPASVVGQFGDVSVRSYRRALRVHEDLERVRPVLSSLVERWSVFSDPTTNPSFVVLRRPPGPALYWEAVRGIVTRQDARTSIDGLGYARTYKNGRGIIGAAAALSWKPRDRTYEVIAYRHPTLWRLHREIDAASVREMDQSFPSTFNNYDYANQRVIIAPHSPCPVLFGIRGDEPSHLPPALQMIRGERPERWVMFETNQATDDHIRRDDWSLRPFTATSLEAFVTSTPITGPGGHVLLRVKGRRSLAVAAYEPSKQFRDVVRALRPGDFVRLYGSIRSRPPGLNLERLDVLALADDLRKVSNPLCPVCGKAMKSIGFRAGFRCVRGHARVPFEGPWRQLVRREITVGSYEPPVCARRHLAKPLKRFPRAGDSTVPLEPGLRVRPFNPPPEAGAIVPPI